MGMFYCHGCESYHDSRDGEYNVTADGKEYCDEALPEDAVIECNNPGWHDTFGGVNLPTKEQVVERVARQNAMAGDSIVNTQGFGTDLTSGGDNA